MRPDSDSDSDSDSSQVDLSFVGRIDYRVCEGELEAGALHRARKQEHAARVHAHEALRGTIRVGLVKKDKRPQWALRASLNTQVHG